MFDDFADFLESITCEISEACQVRGSNPYRDEHQAQERLLLARSLDEEQISGAAGEVQQIGLRLPVVYLGCDAAFQTVLV